MIKNLKYHYYKKRPIVNGKTRFRIEDFVEGTFAFDTDKYRDEQNNYYNVVSDHLDDLGVKERHSFHVDLLEAEECSMKCTSCNKELNVDNMTQDDDSNWFCKECFKVLSPTMKRNNERRGKRGVE